MDFEAQDDGVLAKILKDGQAAVDLAVGVPICVIVDELDEAAAFADFTIEEEESAASLEPIAATSSAPAPVQNVEVTVSLEHILMPSARHLSQSKGVDATGLKGSGKGGRITKGDVLQAFKDGVILPPLATSSTKTASAPAPSAAPVAAASVAAAVAPIPAPIVVGDVVIPSISTSGTFTDIKNTSMRKIIAKRLTESKSTVPHFYATTEIELDNIMALRKKLQSMDVKVSVNDFIIRACALALRDVPEVNSSFMKGQVRVSPTVDISVAVATPGGLITPIVPNTDKLGLSDISSKVKDLATRAKDGKLAPEEYQGGSFCISNLGMLELMNSVPTPI